MLFTENAHCFVYSTSAPPSGWPSRDDQNWMKPIDATKDDDRSSFAIIIIIISIIIIIIYFIYYYYIYFIIIFIVVIIILLNRLMTIHGLMMLDSNDHVLSF